MFAAINMNTRKNKNGVDLNRNFPTKNWVLGENNEMGWEIQRAQRNFRLFQDVTRSSYLY